MFVPHYNSFNRARWAANGINPNWRHNPIHRGNIAYGNATLQQRFGRAGINGNPVDRAARQNAFRSNLQQNNPGIGRQGLTGNNQQNNPGLGRQGLNGNNQNGPGVGRQGLNGNNLQNNPGLGRQGLNGNNQNNPGSGRQGLTGNNRSEQSWRRTSGIDRKRLLQQRRAAYESEIRAKIPGSGRTRSALAVLRSMATSTSTAGRWSTATSTCTRTPTFSAT